MPPYQRRSAVTLAKLASGLFVVLFYFLYSRLYDPTPYTSGRQRPAPLIIQHQTWPNATGAADEAKRARIVRAMRQTFNGYLEKAWTHDDVKPVTGGTRRSRNGWGVFIVDSSSTLALMGLWNELTRSVNYIINDIDFNNPVGLVDPFETTIRYLGGILSLVDLTDAGVIPIRVVTPRKRDALIEQAEALANNLLPAYETSTGLPWPNVNFVRHAGAPRDGVPAEQAHSVGPARAGSNIIENCILSNLTSNPKYCQVATKSWSSLVWSKYIPSIPGLIDGPIDVQSGEPIGRDAHWDGGHDSYYEYLLKASLLFPSSPHRKSYEKRFLDAASALRWNLTSRSRPTAEHPTSHLFMGRWEGPWFVNEQKHLSCFAPGALLLASRALNPTHPSASALRPLALALLEACHHVYNSTPTGLAPEAWSWLPAVSHAPRRQGYPSTWDASSTPPSELKHADSRVAFGPQTGAQAAQAPRLGFYAVDPRFRLRPEYVESLFYAHRVTGESRFRDWAWQAFEAMERHCRTSYGFAGVADVMADLDTDGWEHIDEQESFWPAETLKYLWLTFSSVNETRLEDWVFSTEGHPFRRRDDIPA